ncbi:alpha carbonic anhydrase [Entophlyctis helioformis]|nr:alpha carbonic anhydrase [Entophlyctis helioformis]
MFSLAASAIVALLATAASPAAAHPNCLADVIVRPEHAHVLSRRDGPADVKSAWSYEGETGDAFWGALSPAYTTCATGKHQSPINFEDKAMTLNPAHRLSWPSDSLTNGTFINNGHTVQVNVPAGSGFSLKAGTANDVYELAQFHLHAPSEHHRLEKSYALEAHFVHLTPEKKIAVLGVWFDLAETGSPFLDSLIAAGIPKEEGKTTPAITVNLASIRAATSNSSSPFWSYDGSLTTPPCAEGVKWSVLDKTLPISVAQLKAFTDAMPFNSRSTAAVNKPNSIFGDRPELFGAAKQDTTKPYVPASGVASSPAYSSPSSSAANYDQKEPIVSAAGSMSPAFKISTAVAAAAAMFWL